MASQQKSNKFLLKFCNRLQDVISELCKIFPHENDFAILDTIIAGLIEFNKHEQLAKEYYMFVYKYNTLIQNEDEQGLLDIDLSDNLERINVDSNTGSFKIAHFKKLLQSGVSTQTKKNFFGHLQILNKIIEHIRDVEKSVAFNESNK